MYMIEKSDTHSNMTAPVSSQERDLTPAMNIYLLQVGTAAAIDP